MKRLISMKLGMGILLLGGCAVFAAEPGAAPMANQAPVQEDPKLPRVLLIGDSISGGYTDGVRDLLAGKANIHRVRGNAGPSSSGVQNVQEWMAKANGTWDVIHFNFGLHDIKLGTGGKTDQPYPTTDGHQVSAVDYEKNLRFLTSKMKATGATLIWCSTTPVPSGKLDPLRKPGDEVAYNEIARKVMVEQGIAIDDLYAVVKSAPPGIQLPQNVHFTKEGSLILAKAVAGSIVKALEGRKGSAPGKNSGK